MKKSSVWRILGPAAAFVIGLIIFVIVAQRQETRKKEAIEADRKWEENYRNVGVNQLDLSGSNDDQVVKIQVYKDGRMVEESVVSSQEK